MGPPRFEAWTPSFRLRHLTGRFPHDRFIVLALKAQLVGRVTQRETLPKAGIERAMALLT